MSDFVKLYLMTLHELYLDVKQQVAEAVAAADSAVVAAGTFIQEEITEAVQALMLLDDALNYFGLVGSPIDALCNEFAQQLTNLAFALDGYGYYAAYRRTFAAQAQYVAAKHSYDGFTGGLGGESGGAGASGSWGPQLSVPWFTCFNQHNAVIHPLGAGTPPPESAIDFTVLLGACSDVFVYSEGCDYWEAGIYQYGRWHVWVRFTNLDVIFDSDYGDTPQHTEPTLGYSQIITDRSDLFDCRHSAAQTDWGAIGPIPTWPYDSHWEAILTKDGEQHRDLTMTVIGRHEQSGYNYWLYNLAYWEVINQPSFYDGTGQPIQAGNPPQVMFLNPCSETPAPGKDLKPIPSPLLPILTNDTLRKQLTQRLRLGAIWLPYEVCFERQKLLWEGEQLTFGEV